MGSLGDLAILIDDYYCDVLHVLSQLDGNSAMGPDGIHPLLLRSVPPASQALAYNLHQVISRRKAANCLEILLSIE